MSSSMSAGQAPGGDFDRAKHGLCLLSLDGGGVRGLSTLYILRGLMKSINLKRKAESLPTVKPCEVFDLIGGTSTGGLIAIMLGRLEMDVDACIKAYTDMMEDVFGKRAKPIDWKLNVKGQFSAKVLERAVKSLVPPSEDPEKALLNDSKSDRRPCRVFVCAVRKTNKSLARLRSYDCDALTEEGDIAIWQAARATSAATSFFDPITIGEGYAAQQYVDGALGFNNPLDEVWLEAMDTWAPGLGGLEQILKCVVSIGTGKPGTSDIGDKPWTIAAALKNIAAQTEETERVFAMKYRDLLGPERRYFRFNVDQGLQKVGLEEYKRQGEIIAATTKYLDDHQLVKMEFRECATNLFRKEFWSRRSRDYHRLVKPPSDPSAVQFSVPFHLNDVWEIDHFVGRTSTISSIKQILLPFTKPQRKIVVLHGLGGIGKTQLAIHYASLFQEHYSTVLWFNAKDETSLRQSFVKNAERLPEGAISQELLDDQQDLSSLKKLVQAVKRWLASPRNDKWLLIFDNVDNPKIPQNMDKSAYDIRPYFPEAPQGSIIVTTRWATLKIGKLVEVQKLLEEKESLSILIETSKRADLGNDPKIGELLKIFDGLPLALATAGTYLCLETVTVSEYLQRYRQSWADLQQTSEELLSYEDRTLYSTWNMSYHHIRQQDEAAAQLLKFFAYFDNQDIWYELLTAEQENRPLWLSNVTCSELVFDAAMRKLCNHGLLQGLRDSGGYGMHPCVHSWTLCALNEQSDSDRAITALRCVSLMVPNEPTARNWTLRQRLLPHANHITQWLIAGDSLETETPDVGVLNSLHKIGTLYYHHQMMVDAEAIHQRALAGCEKALGPDYTLTLHIINSLGILYGDQGKMAKAKVMFQRALAGFEKALGPDHTSTLDTICNLGNLYQDQGKTAEAEAMYQRALAGFEKALGLDHTSTLNTINNLGSLYQGQGKTAEAEAMYQRALVGKEKTLGLDHTSTLNTINNLGSLYQDQGKTVEAEVMYQRALAGYGRAAGPDHPSTLDIVYNLGIWYLLSKEYKKAMTYFARAHKGYAATKGADHPETVDVQAKMNIIAELMSKDHARDAVA